MRTADVIGGLAALGVIGFIGYEAWKVNQRTSSSGTPTAPGSSGSSSNGVVPTSTGGYDPGAGTSPFGSNPAVTPTNCPSGTTASYADGYGWTCNENGTQTQQFLGSLPTIEQQSQASGSSVGTTGLDISASGSNARADAMATMQRLQSQYGGTWHVYELNGQYQVLPASRVSYLLGISGTPGTLID